MADGLRVVAVDWSGRATGAARHLWLAEARVDETSPEEGAPELVRLESGRTREQLVDHLVALLADGPLVVGLDFSFALPEWWLTREGYRDGPGLWAAAVDHGEEWLRACEPPFWGRPGRPKPVDEPGAGLRATERSLNVGGIAPKSTFQIGGAGAVGTGSVRGWPHLLRLREAGYAVWPFDRPATPPLVVEVWPRLCTGPVVKSDPEARGEHLDRQLPHVVGRERDLMGASEDAFDAGCTAMVMAEHASTFTRLAAPADPLARCEGWVWAPPSASPSANPSASPSATIPRSRGA